VYLALGANLLTIAFWAFGFGMPGENLTEWLIFLLVLPLIWIVCLIFLAIFVYKGRRELFRRPILKWTIPVVLFCTPLPMSIIYFELLLPDTYLAERDSLNNERHEEWVYRSNNKLAVNKYYTPGNDEPQNRDSTWTYYDKGGDTVKIEKYKNGKLTSTVYKH
jgi:membrane-anchored protein YejM (alkaline phosphatase superfamily)